MCGLNEIPYQLHLISEHRNRVERYLSGDPINRTSTFDSWYNFRDFGVYGDENEPSRLIGGLALRLR